MTVRGVVVGDLRVGGFGGFYVQAPRGDGDSATFDGVFVHDPDDSPATAIGDEVALTGTPGARPGV